MGAFDKVIGYRRVVSELERIASVLVDPSPYQRLGARVPNGLLIAGEPGLGKTLMARCFVEAVGRPCVTLRRTVAGNEFLGQIRDAFVRAAEEAPSIIFLDDLDKFGSGDRNRASEPEYVAVQSCIDDYAGKGVFVLATANNVLRAVPPSLVRAGRFDRTIYLERPEYEDARRIAAHYLEEHAVPNTIDPDVVAQFPMSCAELEARVNAAAVIAASEGSDVVTTEHVLRVCVEHREGRAWRPCREPMGWQAAAKTKRCSDRARCACHEAGHLLVMELIDPGCSSFGVLLGSGARRGRGLTRVRRDHKPFSPDRSPEDVKVLIGLGGLVAEEIAFGAWSAESHSDLEKVTDTVYGALMHGVGGVQHLNVIGDRNRRYTPPSPERIARREAAAVDRIQRDMAEVRSLLMGHWVLHGKVAQLLYDRGIVYGEEVRAMLAHEGDVAAAGSGSGVGAPPEVA